MAARKVVILLFCTSVALAGHVYAKPRQVVEFRAARAGFGVQLYLMHERPQEPPLFFHRSLGNHLADAVHVFQELRDHLVDVDAAGVRLIEAVQFGLDGICLRPYLWYFGSPSSNSTHEIDCRKWLVRL